MAPTGKHGDAVPAALVSRGRGRRRTKSKLAVPEHHHHAKAVSGQKPSRKHLPRKRVSSDTDSLSDTESSDSDADGNARDRRRASVQEDEREKEDKACTVAAFSDDGLLYTAGFDNRTVLVLDPCRPNRGPLCKFVAYGGVSAVSMGHGLRPWPQAVTDSADNGASEAVVGDGRGRIGTLVAGDNTGAVFLLQLSDVVQEAIGQRRGWREDVDSEEENSDGEAPVASPTEDRPGSGLKVDTAMSPRSHGAGWDARAYHCVCVCVRVYVRLCGCVAVWLCGCVLGEHFTRVVCTDTAPAEELVFDNGKHAVVVRPERPLVRCLAQCMWGSCVCMCMS